MTSNEASAVSIKVKWLGNEIEAIVEPSETIAGLKRVLETETKVLAKKQKLLGLKTKEGRPAGDDTTVEDILLKPQQRILLMGTPEETHKAFAEQELVEPHFQVHKDEEEEGEEEIGQVVAGINARDIEEKLQRRYRGAVIKEINKPRDGKKCAVFDIDYTIFALDSKSERPSDLARPYLHDLFSAIYPFFDIVIWSATSMKWIDVKLKELGIFSNPNYKVTLTMDYTSMVTIATPGKGKTPTLFDCKPLAVLWERYGSYNIENTIMVDDLHRNFVLNSQNGLVIRPFKHAMTSGRNDKELLKLKAYLLKIAQLDSLKDLDHGRWKKYAKKEISEMLEE